MDKLLTTQGIFTYWYSVLCCILWHSDYLAGIDMSGNLGGYSNQSDQDEILVSTGNRGMTLCG